MRTENAICDAEIARKNFVANYFLDFVANYFLNP
jgi:hypothetical protein